jgi:hypothetical protein
MPLVMLRHSLILLAVSCALVAPAAAQTGTLERIRSTVAEQGAFPRRSKVGVYATRELDCDPDGGPLANLLNEFDDFIESMAR